MVKRKIYFVTEGIVDGETIQSEKFNQIVNPDTRKTIFDDVFQITECADFETYKDKDEFVACILDISTEYFEQFGEEISGITLTAVDAETNIFQWGLSVMNLEDNSFEFGTIDWKADGKILKFMKTLDELTFEDFGLNAEKNFLNAPKCECGCGGDMNICLKSDEDIQDFIAGMVSENECEQCGVFVVKANDTILFGFSQEGEDDIQMCIAQFEFKGKEKEYDISGLVDELNVHMYGVLVECEPNLFKIIMK